MSSQTRATYDVSRAPFGLLGVPTQINDRAAASTASRGSVVARKRPLATTSLTSLATPGSTTGLVPWLIMSTFVPLASTPMTCQPASAKHAADTEPTYPSPNTASVLVMASCEQLPCSGLDAVSRHARMGRPHLLLAIQEPPLPQLEVDQRP